MTFERYNLMAIFPGDSPVQRYKIKLDPSKQSVELNKITGGSWKAAFNFQQPSPAQVTLHGEMDGRKIQASLHRVELKYLPLYENGFCWIQ